MALAVQQELQTRLGEADRLRKQQVERARYEPQLTRTRYMRVDPNNRLVADSLEAEWNHKLRALTEAKAEYGRRKEEDGKVLQEEQQAAILQLATDFPRFWHHANTPDRERKRLVRWTTSPEVVKQIDELLDHHTHQEIATLLNQRGFRSGKGQAFTARYIARIPRSYALKSRYDRLREAGFLTQEEMPEVLE